MDGYALRDHLSKQVFSVIGGYFENFARSVGSISEETYFQQAIYFILWSKKTEVITIIPPNMNKIVGTSPNTKKVNIIPKIGNKE